MKTPTLDRMTTHLNGHSLSPEVCSACQRLHVAVRYTKPRHNVAPQRARAEQCRGGKTTSIKYTRTLKLTGNSI